MRATVLFLSLALVTGLVVGSRLDAAASDSAPVEGRIVQAYREGPGLTLHLDKGSAAGVKPGMSGNVLSGSSGEDALDGGEFKIVSVLDANKSVGKTNLHSIGKNNRVMINVTK